MISTTDSCYESRVGVSDVFTVVSATLVKSSRLVFHSLWDGHSVFFAFTSFPTVRSALVETQRKQFSLAASEDPRCCACCGAPIEVAEGAQADVISLTLLQRTVPFNTVGQGACDLLFLLSCGCVVVSRFLLHRGPPAVDSPVLSGGVELHSVLWLPVRQCALLLGDESPPEEKMKNVPAPSCVWSVDGSSVFHVVFAFYTASLFHLQLTRISTSSFLESVVAYYHVDSIARCPLQLYRYLFPEVYYYTKRVVLTRCVTIPKLTSTTVGDRSSGEHLRLSLLLLHQYQTSPVEFPEDLLSTGVVDVVLSSATNRSKVISALESKKGGKGFVRFGEHQYESDILYLNSCTVSEGPFSIRNVSLSHPTFLCYFSKLPLSGGERERREPSQREYAKRWSAEESNDLLGVFCRPFGQPFVESFYLKWSGVSTTEAEAVETPMEDETFTFTLYDGNGEVARAVVGGYVETAVQLHCIGRDKCSVPVLGAVLTVVLPQGSTTRYTNPTTTPPTPHLLLLEVLEGKEKGTSNPSPTYSVRSLKFSNPPELGRIAVVDGVYDVSQDSVKGVELFYYSLDVNASRVGALKSITLMMEGDGSPPVVVLPDVELDGKWGWPVEGRDVQWLSSPSQKRLDFPVCRAPHPDGRVWVLWSNGQFSSAALDGDKERTSTVSMLPPLFALTLPDGEDAGSQEEVQDGVRLLFSSDSSEIFCTVFTLTELVSHSVIDQYSTTFHKPFDTEECFMFCAVKSRLLIFSVSSGHVVYVARIPTDPKRQLSFRRQEVPTVERHRLPDSQGVLIGVGALECSSSDTAAVRTLLRPCFLLLQFSYQVFRPPLEWTAVEEENQLYFLQHIPDPFIQCTLQDTVVVDYPKHHGSGGGEARQEGQESLFHLLNLFHPSLSFLESGEGNEGSREEVPVLLRLSSEHTQRGTVCVRRTTPENGGVPTVPMCTAVLTVNAEE